METKRMIVGFLSLFTGVVWLILLVAQGARLELARAVLGSTAPIMVRLSALPSVVLVAAGATLVLPLLLGGTGTMLGMQGCGKVLRICSQIGMAVSATVVIAFGAMVLPAVGGGGARLGPGAAFELTGAANLLVLHGLLLFVATRYQPNLGLRTTAQTAR